MPLILRQQKGSRLTIQEMDGNFEYLESQINKEPIEPNLGPVLDNTITDPSTLDLENGDRYIVPTNSVNDWNGQDGNIAEWDDFNQEWTYYIPSDLDRTIVTTGTNAGNVYEYDSGNNVWNEVIVPVSNNTPFFLNGTTIDAGSNKTNTISRTGGLCIGTTNNAFSNKFRVIGNGVMDGYNTRTGYASTNDITRTGKFFAIADFDLSYSNFASQFYTILMSTNGNSNGSSNQTTINFSFKRQMDDVYIYVNIEQKANNPGGTMTLDESDIDFLYNDTTKKIRFYYKQKENYSRTSFTFLNGTEYNATKCTFLNQYLGVSDLSGEVNDTVASKYIQIGRIDNFAFNSSNQIIDNLVNITDDNIRNRFIRTSNFNVLATEDFTNLQNSSLTQTINGFQISINDNNTPTDSNLTLSAAIDSTQKTDGTYTSESVMTINEINYNISDSSNGTSAYNRLSNIVNDIKLENVTDDIVSNIYIDVTDLGSNELKLAHQISKNGSELILKSTDAQLSVLDDDNNLNNTTLFSPDKTQSIIVNDITGQITTINTALDSHNLTIDSDGTSQFISGLAITNDGANLISGLYAMDSVNSKSNNIVSTTDEVRISSIDGTSGKLLLTTPEKVQVWDDTQNDLFFEAGEFGITLDAISGVENLTIKNLLTFNNNGDAIAGGLSVDQVYKTSTGELRIVI